jgi:chorismate dehydratase
MKGLECDMSGRSDSRTRRVGCVSYLNAKPLIYGLEEADVAVELEVPSKLLGGLREGRFDVALLPVIDYQRMDGLCVVPSGGIGCDGETLTVRIFSRSPIEKIEALACDTDSHTSVALARVILAEQYGIRPTFVDLTEGRDDEARLLIGDKVVQSNVTRFGHQLDLGKAWKDLTGLPFVFACWMGRSGVELGDLPGKLSRARERGVEHIGEIVARHAGERGWTNEMALRYLTENLKFEISELQIRAMERFFQLAARHRAIEPPIRVLRLYEG